MKRGLVVLTIVNLIGVGSAGAAVHRGEIDLSLSATWFNEDAGDNGQDFDGIFGMAALGLFLTDHIEAEVAGLGLHSDGNPTTPYLNEQEDTFWAVGIKGKYHFMPKNPWVPYVGMQFFWGELERDAPGDLYDADLDGFLWGPLAGLRFELTPHNSFFVEYQFHIWGGDISDEDCPHSPDWETGNLVTLGLIHSFR